MKSKTKIQKNIFMVASIEKYGAWVENDGDNEKKKHFDGMCTTIHKVSIEQISIAVRWKTVFSEDMQEIGQLSVQITDDVDMSELR